MNWLVTIRKSADLARLAVLINNCGGKQNEEQSPVPLGDSEIIVEVNGPQDLPDRLRVDRDVIDVYPNSDMSLH